MGIDTIKVAFTYGIAAFLIIGGMTFLYLIRSDPQNTLIPLVAGFIGAAIQFVFNRETQTSTARQVERATAAGGAATAAATAAAVPTNGGH